MDIGDRFQFLDYIGGGTVLELDRGRILVACDDGREIWVDQREIMPEDVYSVPDSTQKQDDQPEATWDIGAKVGYLNEAGGGVIVGEGDKGFLVEDEDGFERWFPKDLLVLLDTDVMKQLKESETENKDRRVRTHNIKPKKQNAILEVDLHIHELLEFDSHLSDHEKLIHQLTVARHQIEKAQAGHYKKVILIHGVGKGVLKEKLHEMLEGMERVEFYDASLQKYGKGATEVVFR
ncbi:MAG: Smr/MutS family protein [Flavobacteriia bacterium]|nr:Smr/MutS family protein [Flavobacteriia bacterium]